MGGCDRLAGELAPGRHDSWHHPCQSVSGRPHGERRGDRPGAGMAGPGLPDRARTGPGQLPGSAANAAGGRAVRAAHQRLPAPQAGIDHGRDLRLGRRGHRPGRHAARIRGRGSQPRSATVSTTTTYYTARRRRPHPRTGGGRLARRRPAGAGRRDVAGFVADRPPPPAGVPRRRRQRCTADHRDEPAAAHSVDGGCRAGSHRGELRVPSRSRTRG